MIEDKNQENARRGRSGIPRKITKQRLHNIALHHLQRYASSAENLRRVLERRVYKAGRHRDTDLKQAKEWIAEVVEALVRSDAVDDSRFAEGKATTMIRRGQSPSKIRAYLASKGVARDVVDDALISAEETFGDPEWQAAQAYARRRKIGPYRTVAISPDIRQKEMAALGRAGFSYDMARRIVDATDPTEDR